VQLYRWQVGASNKVCRLAFEDSVLCVKAGEIGSYVQSVPTLIVDQQLVVRQLVLTATDRTQCIIVQERHGRCFWDRVGASI
jgi:hypothetical protein